MMRELVADSSRAVTASDEPTANDDGMTTAATPAPTTTRETRFRRHRRMTDFTARRTVPLTR
ncbi:hypothetical protein AKH00_05865 [Microbacterium sp. GCS4]|nr:hypothetical protein AKH00_05865 [Microbacterium sp. GCS4]